MSYSTKRAKLVNASGEGNLQTVDIPDFIAIAITLDNVQHSTILRSKNEVQWKHPGKH